MKQKLWLFILCLLPFKGLAQEIDLLSDEMLLGTASSQQELDVNLPLEEEKDLAEAKDEDDSGNMFGFIQPILNLFSADDENKTDDANEQSAKKETILERNTRLANEGDLKYQMDLGYMYLYGTNGVKQDFAKSFEYYAMAAQQNDPIAVNNLGSLYFNGIGTKRDVKTALGLFAKAAELGNDDAAVNLAFINLSGGTKNPERNAKAVELFKKAAKENKIARFMLGYAYYTGFVVNKDMNEAYKLIRSTAQDEAKIDEAQIVLAQMYINGQGTVQDYKSAIKAYRSAVEQGNIEACLKLGDIYTQGKITAANPVLAHTIYNIAAAKGNEEAAQKRDALGAAMEMESLTKAQESAREYVAQPSELTSYIRQTYGGNIRHYIDLNL